MGGVAKPYNFGFALNFCFMISLLPSRVLLGLRCHNHHVLHNGEFLLHENCTLKTLFTAIARPKELKRTVFRGGQYPGSSAHPAGRSAPLARTSAKLWIAAFSGVSSMLGYVGRGRHGCIMMGANVG